MCMNILLRLVPGICPKSTHSKRIPRGSRDVEPKVFVLRVDSVVAGFRIYVGYITLSHNLCSV